MQLTIQDVVQGIVIYRKAVCKYNLKPSTLERNIRTELTMNCTLVSKLTSFSRFSVEEEKLLKTNILLNDVRTHNNSGMKVSKIVR